MAGAMTAYAPTPAQFDRLANLPRVDRRGLPRARREWIGHRVAVYFMHRRGNYHTRTTMQFRYGVLVAADKPDQIALRMPDGTTHPIHYSRVQIMWDKGPPPTR